MAWTLKTNLKGPAGATGPAGTDGTGGSGGGLPFIPGTGLPPTPKAGRWYTFPQGSTLTTLVHVTGTAYTVPVLIPATPTIPCQGLGILVSAAGTNSQLRAAQYACDDSGEPTTLIADLGYVDATSAGAKVWPTPPTLTAGWTAFAVIAVTANCTVRAMSGGSFVPWLNQPAVSLSGGGFMRSGTIGTGSWPTTFGEPTGQAATSPRLELIF